MRSSEPWNHVEQTELFFLLIQFFQDFLVLLAAQIQFGEKVGTPLTSAAQRFFASPARDLLMVA